MARQDMLQMKEQGGKTEKNPKEMKISNLLDKISKEWS